MSKCIVSRRVKIPKEFLEREKIENDLIIRDSRPSEFASRKPLVCFEERSDSYIVPKMYGLKLISEQNLEFEDVQKPGVDVDISFEGSLREPQVPEVEKTIEALEENQGGVMCLYCGFGKTTCSLKISCHFKKRTLVLVHTTALLEQWKERIEGFVKNSSVGVIQRDKVDVEGRTHVVALMQSVSRRNYDQNVLDSFGLLIVDEAHHICAEELGKCMAKIGCKLRLGLSATPDRKDGFTRFLFDSIGDICSHVERDPLRMLVEIVDVTSGPSEIVSMFRKGKESPNMARMINNLCDVLEPKGLFRTNLIVESVMRALEQNRHIIVLSDRRDHLKSMGTMLSDLGVEVGYMVGGIKPKDIAAVSSRRVIMATYAYCSEGLDIPSLDTCVFATPRSDIVQCCGRILRYHADKQIPYVIDFSDDCPVFVGQMRKRSRYYKKLGATVLHLEENLEVKATVSKRSRDVECDFPFSCGI